MSASKSNCDIISSSDMIVVLSGAAWICRSAETWGCPWAVGDRGEWLEGGVEGVGGGTDSRLAPQPDSASQFRIASGSQPRRCEAEVRELD